MSDTQTASKAFNKQVDGGSECFQEKNINTWICTLDHYVSKSTH